MTLFFTPPLAPCRAERSRRFTHERSRRQAGDSGNQRVHQDSKVVVTNEGWPNSAAIAAAAIQTGALTLPSGSKDAAVLITLNPGAYTAQIKSAKNASSGVALIEIYEVP